MSRLVDGLYLGVSDLYALCITQCSSSVSALFTFLNKQALKSEGILKVGV